MRSLRDLGEAIAGALTAWFGSKVVRWVMVGMLFALGWTWVVARFYGLDRSPPGFFMDEAAPAVHAMCLAETGKDMDGKPWPLYSSAAGGGHHPLTLHAFAILWTGIFGTSRAAFRSVSAFFILLTSIALFLLARGLAAMIPGRSAEDSEDAAAQVFPWLVLLAALLSPWSFQFSRVAWEAPLAPAFLILSLVGLLRLCRSGKLAIAWAVFAGFCAAASMTSYPPLRPVVPLVLLTAGTALLAVTRDWPARWNFAKGLGLAAAVAATLLIPTIEMLFAGQINERMNNVAIWRPDWVKEHAAGLPRWAFLIKAFLDNIAVHLQPSYLFVHGDPSLRHSPQIAGELSPLDLLALLLALGAILFVLVRLVRGRVPITVAPGGGLSPSSRWLLATALLSLLGAFFGLVPAALTYEALPHAMRSIGAWPFVALFTGAVLALGWSHRRWVAPVLTLFALLHTLRYLPKYYRAYDKAENHWFMREMTDTLAEQRKRGKTVEKIIAEHLAYSYSYDEVLKYYLMTEANMKCDQAAAALRAYQDQEKGK